MDETVSSTLRNLKVCLKELKTLCVAHERLRCLQLQVKVLSAFCESKIIKSALLEEVDNQKLYAVYEPIISVLNHFESNKEENFNQMEIEDTVNNAVIASRSLDEEIKEEELCIAPYSRSSIGKMI